MKPKIIGKSKIPWCTHGWNFGVGCSRGCTVESMGFNCYAKEQFDKYEMYDLYEKNEADFIASSYNQQLSMGASYEEAKKKFSFVDQPPLKNLKKFKPYFLEHAFAKRFPKKPSSIFMCAMTDPEWWQAEWWGRALQKIKEHPEHTFILLTKNPSCYYAIQEGLPQNVALGATALNENEITTYQDTLRMFPDNVTFLSIEPLQCEIDPACIDPAIDLVIVGGLSGPGVQPEFEWVQKFKEKVFFDRRMISLPGPQDFLYFEKDNLKKIVNRELIQELPWVIEGKK